MSEITALPTGNLQTLILETEKTLADLKRELERREHLSQEREITHLENHMKSAELSLKTIKEVIQYLSDSIRAHKA